MKFSKPINIIYEILFFMVSIFLLISLFGYILPFSPDSRIGPYLSYLLYALFGGSVFSITLRAFIRKQRERRLISSFCFGLCVGSFIWLMFAIRTGHFIRSAESITENILELGFSILMILKVGVIAAVIALILSILFDGIFMLISRILKSSN